LGASSVSFDVDAIGAASSNAAGRVGVSRSALGMTGIAADGGAVGVRSIADRLGLGVDGDPATAPPAPRLRASPSASSAHGDACASASWTERASPTRAPMSVSTDAAG